MNAMKPNQLLIAAALAAAILIPIGAATKDKTMVQPTTPAAVRLPIEGELPSFGGATVWLNSSPLTAAGLRGKVVLVDFWTYTCINWRRHYPYVRAWADKYRDHGLVVIGVHAPEFVFEKNLDNVRWAAKDLRVDHPIAIDNDYAVWHAFKNHYWPALYFVDAQGHIRHHQFGEGDYEQSEKVIQQLLGEAQTGAVDGELVSVHAEGLEAAADWRDLKSPETYLGYEQAENFASPGGALSGTRHAYTAPGRLSANHWALSGDWTVERDAAALNLASGRIALRFHARDLHLVLAPPAQDRPIRFRITIDGAAPGEAHGVDVNAEGWGSVREARLYQLVRQSGSVADRTFEIEFLDAGVRAYVFTFG